MSEINEKGEHIFRLPNPWEGPRHKAVSRAYLAYRQAVMATCVIDDENDDLSDDAMLKRLKELSDYIEKLEGALTPFAEAVPFFAQRYLDCDPVVDLDRPFESVRLEVGHLRAAARALSLPRQKTE